MDPNLYKSILEQISSGITSTNVITAIVTFLSAGLGAYLSKRGEFAALKDDFKESLDMLRQQTEAVEQTKAEVERLRSEEKLAFELQKTRGVERQELRYRSYGLLWKDLRRLAIYDENPLNREVVGQISSCLSDWYFSENGGLLLTPQARNFYFALQDLLRHTSRLEEEWDVDRSTAYDDREKETFKDLLSRLTDDKYRGQAETPSSVFKYFREGDFHDWTAKAAVKGNVWRNGINDIAREWGRLDGRQRFAALQQAGSILRTSLTNDLESRLG